MSTEKWTDKAREALVGSQRDAEERKHSQVEPEHLLLALVTQPTRGYVSRLSRDVSPKGRWV